RPLAAAGDVHQVDAGHRLEQLAGHMGRGAGAGGCHGDLARIVFGVGDELRHGLCRNRPWTTMTCGTRKTAATGAMAWRKLKLLVAERVALRATAGRPPRRRYPSARQRQHTWVPRFVPPRGWLSTRNGGPSRADSRGANRRARVS